MNAGAAGYDVMIVGGGPAGSVLARRLAMEQLRVLLLAGPSPGGTEGVSRRTRDLLAMEGLDGALDILRGPVPRGGAWGAGRTIAGTEWLVDRSLLAARLHAAARASGADVVDGIAATTIRDAAGFRVVTRAGDCYQAPILVDARGRRGRERRGPRLVAIGQNFVTRRMDLAPATQVHMLADGWCWLVTEPGNVWVQLVGAPRRQPLRNGLAAACAALPQLRAVLEAAEPTAAATVRPAHARLGPAGCDLGRWRVGDAAYATDPLSGQGIYHALCSARAVAVALNSVLAGVEAALAQRFIAELHERMWRRGVKVAAEFYREAAAAGPFWTQTADAYASLIPVAGASPPAIESRPVLDSGRIRERRVCVTAAQPEGVWHVDGVALAPLMDYLQATESASIVGAAAALARPPNAVATAVRWLHTAGALPMPGAASISAGD